METLKKIALFILLLSFSFILMPALAFAHTGLKSSNPADGTVVKEELKEIRLVFQDNIEPASNLQITDDMGTAYKIADTQVLNNELVGTLNEPLPNGSYEAAWKIISKDGHSLKGSFQFRVELPPAETPTQTIQPSPSPTPSTAAPAESSSPPPSPAETNTASSGSNISIMLFIFIPVGILILYMFVSALRKKNK